MAFVALAIMYGPVQLNAQSTLTNSTDNQLGTIKGLTAYFSGDFKTAFREWKLSAEKGDAKAHQPGATRGATRVLPGLAGAPLCWPHWPRRPFPTHPQRVELRLIIFFGNP